MIHATLEPLTVPIDSVQPHARNPRRGVVAAIAESLQVNGQYRPIVVNRKDGSILGGNHTWRAAKELGWESIAVTWVDVDEDGAARILLVDNRTNDIATWDDEGLLAVLDSLEGLEGTGYDDTALTDLRAECDRIRLQATEVAEDPGPDVDHAEELCVKWATELGQLWMIPSLTMPGSMHRLLCGDSTKPEDVALLTGKEKAQICWTDPPWNVAYGESTHPSWKKRSIVNDNLGAAFPAFVSAFCAVIVDTLLPGAPLYLAMSAQEWPTIHAHLQAAGFHWSSTIIWVKDHAVLSRKDYHTRYEPLWYGWREGAPRLVSLEDRTQNDVWEIPRPVRSESHPTMKPVELVARALGNSSRIGDVVFEPFAGSGATLVAAEQTGRRCCGVELEPKYVAVILERLAGMGLTPRLSED